MQVARDSQARAGSRQRRRRAAAGAVAVVGIAGLVVLLTVIARHALPGDSDSATAVLEGKSMAGGNIMLQGWSFSLDSFWSIDAPFYALAVVVAGVAPAVLYVVPAVLAAGVILVGARLAGEGFGGVAGVAAAATVVVLLALPSHTLIIFFLRGPLHTGTVLYCLLAFAALTRTGYGWRWWVAVVLLGLGALGDLLVVALGIVPIAVAALVTMVRRRGWRAGVPALAAAAASGALAAVVHLVTSAVGGFQVASARGFAKHGQILVNLRVMAARTAQLLGVGPHAGKTGLDLLVDAARTLALVLIAAGLILALARIAAALARTRARRPDAAEEPGAAGGLDVDDVVGIAFLCTLGVFALLGLADSLPFSRYLMPTAVFGAVLAGRLLGRLVTRLDVRWLRAAVASLGVAVVAILGVSVGQEIAAPPPVMTASVLGQFLLTHDLRQGIGDYWSSSITTVVSHGSVVVRPVTVAPDGRLMRDHFNSAASWYRGERFDFLVRDLAVLGDRVTLAAIDKTFGPPRQVYAVGDFRVLVWDKPLVLPAPAA